MNNNNFNENILSNIFYLNIANSKLVPIFKNISHFEIIINFLIDQKITISQKLKVIKELFVLINKNEILIPYIHKKIENKLIEEIINLYLKNDINIKEEKIIFKFIKYYYNVISLNKKLFEFIYQKLSKYFYNLEEIILDENLLFKYLKIFKLLYGNNNFYKDNNNENNDENNDENNELKTINNFIYFNGIESKLDININKNSSNLITDFPILGIGITISFWIKFNDEIIDNYFDIINKEYNENNKKEIILINIISGENENLLKIQVKLISKNSLKFIINDESEEIKLSNYNSNEWNNFTFLLTQRESFSKSEILKFFINYTKVYENNKLRKFKFDYQINKLSLFENFYGLVTSVIIFTKNVENILKDFNHCKNGLYKLKFIHKYLLSNNKNYLFNSINYKYKNKFDNKQNILNNYNLEEVNKSLKNFIIIFTPFTYNDNFNYIDDLCNNYIGYLGKEDCVNYYNNNSKNIFILGGINNLLPIMELLYSTISKQQKIFYKNINKNILSEKILIFYFKILYDIFFNNKKNKAKINNIIHATENNYFISLSLFLEKFPKYLFSNNIMKLFLKIGKIFFQSIDFINDEHKKKSFINLILLNEKIILKYSIDSINLFFKGLYKFYLSDRYQLQNFLDISKIIFLLRFFDLNKYNEYCCEEHKKFIKTNSNTNLQNMKVMNPPLNNIEEYLFKILELILDDNENEKYNFFNIPIKLFYLLILDLSPCLQKNIIKLLIKFFENDKISIKNKKIMLNKILEKNGLEICLFAYSVSLMDVRVYFIKLLKMILFTKYSDYQNIKNNKIDLNFIYEFIEEKITFDDINVEIKNDFIQKLSIKNNNVIEKEKENEFEKQNILLKKIVKKEFTNEKNINEINCLKNNFFKVIYLNKHINIDSMEPINNYYDENMYNEYSYKMLDELYEFLIIKIEQKNEIKFKFNNKALNIIFKLLSKFGPYLIELFIIKILASLKLNYFLEERDFYESEIFYKWLLETIYLFESEYKIYEEFKNIKDLKCQIELIKNNTNKIFNIIMNNNKKGEKFEEIFNKRINYLILYSNHLKYLIKIDDSKRAEKINIINNITRKLLNNLLTEQNNNLQKNNIIKNIFYYMTFYNIIDEIEKNSIDFESINEENMIPNYILKSLSLNNENIYNNKELILREKWNDYSLFENIIDYYVFDFSNLYRLYEKYHKLENEEKINDINFQNLLSKLLNLFAFDKKNRNILQDDLRFLLNLDNNNNIIKKYNIMNIIIILLSIAVILTENKEEKNFWIQKYQNFIIYIIFCSLNISQKINNYNEIQNILHYYLGYSLIFLKTKDKKYYEEIMLYIINPLIDKIINNNKFQNKKKLLFTNSLYITDSAIFFIYDIPIKDLNEKNKKKKIDEENNLEQHKLNPPFEKPIDKNLNNINVITDNNNNDEFNNDNIDKNEKNLNLFLGFKINIKFKLNSSVYKYIYKFDTFSELKDFSEERNKIYFFFQKLFPNMSRNKFNSKKYREAKKKLFDIIKKLVKNSELDLKKYSNNSFIEEKIKKNKYKKIKKILFSWNNFWSNKFLFLNHPELIKYKIKNFYSNDFTKFLTSPILDINYYMPIFLKFNPKNLFNSNNYEYKINLDIDDILRDEFEENNEINILKQNKEIFYYEVDLSNIHFNINNFGFNYLESIYKVNLTELWNIYLKLYIQILNFNIIKFSLIDSHTILECKKDISNEQNMKKYENFYNCCQVKLSHHIKGIISIEKQNIKFIININESENLNIKNNTNNLNENSEIDINYDNDRKTCFGSTFIYKKNDKDKINLKIPYDNIKFIFKRKYFYQGTAIEIYTNDYKSYYFNFNKKEDCKNFINDLLVHIKLYRKLKLEKKSIIIGYESLIKNIKNEDNNNNLSLNKINSYFISDIINKWQNYRISNLRYLMLLNIFANRSFNDLTQYPILPWLFNDYHNNKNETRNLSLPMGMMDFNENAKKRKETYLEIYESMKNDFKENNKGLDYDKYLEEGEKYYQKKYENDVYEDDNKNLKMNPIEINQRPYFYGSHYSNPTYVSHFLMRMFPFSCIMIEIQGNKFDDPNRLFYSLEKSFESATTQKVDLRELIPEFYYFPEIFLNINNFNFLQNQKNDKKKDINENEILNKNINLIDEEKKKNELIKNNNNINENYNCNKNINNKNKEEETLIDECKNVNFLNDNNNENKEIITQEINNQIEPNLSYIKLDPNSTKELKEEKSLNETNKITLNNENKNINDINIKYIHNVILPQWCNNISTTFVQYSREKLEKENNLNYWINLIFGSCQRGKKSEEHHNIFMANTNQDNVDLNKIKDKDNRDAIMRLAEMGLTPNQIFTYDLDKRINFKNFMLNNELMYQSLGECKNNNLIIYNILNCKKYDEMCVIKKTYIKTKINQKVFPKFIKIKNISNEETLILTNLNSYFIINLNSSIRNISPSETQLFQINSFSDNFAINSKMSIEYNYPIIIFNNNKQIIKGGFWDGRLEFYSINYTNNKEKEIKNFVYFNKIYFTPIIVMKINRKENTLICGTKLGIVYVYLLNNNEKECKIILKKTIFDHYNEITSLYISDVLNLFVTTAIDGYVNIYILPSCKLIRIINLNPENNEKICYYANNVFVSNCPLPSITLYINKLKIFKNYSINGTFINEINEEDGSSIILSPIVFQELSYKNEFLIYGTDNGYIKIRSFPNMYLKNKILINKQQISVNEIEISLNQKYCFAWNNDKKIYIIKDKTDNNN